MCLARLTTCFRFRCFHYLVESRLETIMLIHVSILSLIFEILQLIAPGMCGVIGRNAQLLAAEAVKPEFDPRMDLHAVGQTAQDLRQKTDNATPTVAQ